MLASPIGSFRKRAVAVLAGPELQRRVPVAVLPALVQAPQPERQPRAVALQECDAQSREPLQDSPSVVPVYGGVILMLIFPDIVLWLPRVLR